MRKMTAEEWRVHVHRWVWVTNAKLAPEMSAVADAQLRELPRLPNLESHPGSWQRRR